MATVDAHLTPVTRARLRALTLAKWPLLGVVLIGVVALAGYAPVLGDFFALDDFIWLRATAGPPLDVLGRALTFPTDTPTAVETPFWRPLIDLYFLVMQRLWGERALPYHLVNLILHVGVATLLLVVLRQCGRSWPVALSGAVLFAVSPAYTFTVSWISAVTEVAAALLSLLTLLLFLRAGRRATAPALLTFALALTAKESAVMTLPVLGLFALLGTGATPRRAVMAALRVTAPFAALTAVYLVFIFLGEYRAKADLNLYRFDAHALDHLWQHLTWLPLPIAPERAPWLEPLRPVAAVALLASGPLALIFRRPLLATLWAWTLLALLPYLFFTGGVEQRYTYPAMIPFTMLVVSAVATLVAPVGRRLPGPLVGGGSALVVAALTVVLAAETRRQQAWLSDQATLYAALLRDGPAACGPLPPGSRVTISASPLWDLFGASTAMALNLRYERVLVSLTGVGLPTERTEPACALRYVDGRFVVAPP